MKYIRTKDGIIDTETKYLNFVSKEEYLKQVKENREGLIVSYIENNVWYCYCESDGCVEWKDDILKQADTIEELCDGFVFKDTYSNELHFLDKNSGISLLGASLFEETLRGFIETDKGLIYVAKMNDKGELELL